VGTKHGERLQSESGRDGDAAQLGQLSDIGFGQRRGGRQTQADAQVNEGSQLAGVDLAVSGGAVEREVEGLLCTSRGRLRCAGGRCSDGAVDRWLRTRRQAAPVLAEDLWFGVCGV